MIRPRDERAIEAEQEKPIKAPQRVSLINGEPAITLDLATQRNSGIATVTLSKAPHQAQVQAYGRIYQSVLAQSQTLAYIDTYMVLAVAASIMFVLAFIVRRNDTGAASTEAAVG